MRRLVMAMILVGSSAVCGELDAAVIDSATYNGHVYMLLAPKWWKESEDEAVELGGHLVTVNDANENAWVLNTFGPSATTYASQHNLPNQDHLSLWIGLNDCDQEYNYVWASKELYTGWQRPAEGWPDEDFIGMFVNYGPATPGTWHDLVNVYNGIDLVFGVVESAVPEPATLIVWLLLGGLAIIVGRRWRKRTA